MNLLVGVGDQPFSDDESATNLAVSAFNRDRVPGADGAGQVYVASVDLSSALGCRFFSIPDDARGPMHPTIKAVERVAGGWKVDPVGIAGPEALVTLSTRFELVGTQRIK